MEHRPHRLDHAHRHLGGHEPHVHFQLRLSACGRFAKTETGQLLTHQTLIAAQFERIVERWGIRRSHPEFWRYFHDLAEHIRETQPLEAGVLDMNRYQNF